MTLEYSDKEQLLENCFTAMKVSLGWKAGEAKNLIQIFICNYHVLLLAISPLNNLHEELSITMAANCLYQIAHDLLEEYPETEQIFEIIDVENLNYGSLFQGGITHERQSGYDNN